MLQLTNVSRLILRRCLNKAAPTIAQAIRVVIIVNSKFVGINLKLSQGTSLFTSACHRKCLKESTEAPNPVARYTRTRDRWTVVERERKADRQRQTHTKTEIYRQREAERDRESGICTGNKRQCLRHNEIAMNTHLIITGILQASAII